MAILGKIIRRTLEDIYLDTTKNYTYKKVLVMHKPLLGKRKILISYRLTNFDTDTNINLSKCQVTGLQIHEIKVYNKLKLRK